MIKCWIRDERLIIERINAGFDPSPIMFVRSQPEWSWIWIVRGVSGDGGGRWEAIDSIIPRLGSARYSKS